MLLLSLFVKKLISSLASRSVDEYSKSSVERGVHNTNHEPNNNPGRCVWLGFPERYR